MELYPLNAQGIHVYCSNLIVDPREHEIVYVMSITGYQTAVKGIIANFLEHNTIYIKMNPREYYLTRSYLNYTFHSKKLPSGLLDAVIFPKLALPNNDEQQNSFFMITNNGNDIQKLFFRHLDNKTDIPLHPSWDSWLWNTFKEQDSWLYKLKTLTGTLKGFKVQFNPYQLQNLIANAIQFKQPELITCMRTNGGSFYELDLS